MNDRIENTGFTTDSPISDLSRITLNGASYRVHPLLPARFFRKINITYSGCWLWKGHVNRNSRYPQFAYAIAYDGTRLVYAHRWAYTMIRGPIPQGLECDHVCRRSLCVNPWHLELVTHAENVRRRGPTRFRGDGKTWNGGNWWRAKGVRP